MAIAGGASAKRSRIGRISHGDMAEQKGAAGRELRRRRKGMPKADGKRRCKEILVGRWSSTESTPRGSLSVLLVGGEDVETGAARGTLLALREPSLVVAEAPLAWAPAFSAKADVVMVLLGADEREALGYLQSQFERTPRPALFALLSEESPVLMRRVLRTGADEVLVLPLVQDNLMSPLLKVREALRRNERRAGGKIFSVASLGGGVGVTTLCVNLGVALQGADGARVVLVDLDLQAGDLSDRFGAEPDRGIIALARLHHKPDSRSLEAALTKHASGLYVLGAPARIEDAAEVSETMVGNLLEALRQLFDYVVIDCGAHVNENSIAAWERSHELLYVIEQSVGAAHHAGRFLELFPRLGIDGIEPRLVLNRYRPGHPIDEAQMTAMLKCRICARLPRDERVTEKPAAAARKPSQMVPNSALVRALRNSHASSAPARESRARPKRARALILSPG
jgi:pilus assembly protein CpaE